MNHRPSQGGKRCRRWLVFGGRGPCCNDAAAGIGVVTGPADDQLCHRGERVHTRDHVCVDVQREAAFECPKSSLTTVIEIPASGSGSGDYIVQRDAGEASRASDGLEAGAASLSKTGRSGGKLSSVNGRGLDELDRRIIHALYNDGRMSMRALAERLNVSRAAAYARVQALTESGAIAGYRAVVDYHKIGRRTTAYVSLKIHQRHASGLTEQLHAIPEVRSIAFVTGEYDIVLLVFAEDDEALRRVVMEDLQALPAIRSTNTTLLFGFELSEVW